MQHTPRMKYEIKVFVCKNFRDFVCPMVGFARPRMCPAGSITLTTSRSRSTIGGAARETWTRADETRGKQGRTKIRESGKKIGTSRRPNPGRLFVPVVVVLFLWSSRPGQTCCINGLPVYTAHLRKQGWWLVLLITLFFGCPCRTGHITTGMLYIPGFVGVVVHASCLCVV